MASVFEKLVGFLMLPFYAHIFKVEGYGVISMIDTSLSVLTIFFAGNVHTAIIRIYYAQQTAEKKKNVIGTAILLVWGVGSALILIPVVFCSPISKFILGTSEYAILFALGLCIFVIQMAGHSASAFLIIKQKSLIFSTIGLLIAIIAICLNILLVIILDVGLIGIFITSIITAFIKTAAFHFAAIRENGLKYDRKIAVELLRFQLPLLPGETISFLGRQAERILVRVMIGLEGLGILEMAYKFPPLLNLFITFPFTRAWRTKSMEIAGRENAPMIMGDMFTRYFFFIVFTGLLFVINIQDVLCLLTPQEFWPAARIANVEVVTTILFGCTSYFSFGILFQKKTKIISNIKLTVVPLKIAISFLAIRKWGIAGAAYSALFIEAITFMLISRKSQKLYRINYESKKICVIICISTALIIVLYNRSYLDFLPAIYLREYLFPLIDGILRASPIVAWKSGKLVAILGTKQEYLISLIINSTLCLSYFGVMPFIFKKTIEGRS